MNHRPCPRISCAHFALAVCAVALIAAPSIASDHTGVYGIVDRVEFLPDAESPRSVKVWGVFMINARGSAHYPGSILPPMEGYLSLGLVEGKEELCRNEWKDLERCAGQNQVVAFGLRNSVPTLRRPGATEEKAPDPHPLHGGVHVVTDQQNWRVRQLRLFPRPVDPTDTESTGGGELPKLVVKNCLEATPTLRYLFRVEAKGGEVFASPLITPGEKNTVWTVPFYWEPGTEYRWSVRVIDLGDGARDVVYPVATATFRTGKSLTPRMERSIEAPRVADPPATRSIWRTSTWDAVPISLAALHGGAILACPHALLFGAGMWWHSNAITHPFIHRPFFRSSHLNRGYALYATLLLGYPFRLWRDRHLAHHAEVAGTDSRPIRLSTELLFQGLLLAALWSILLLTVPRLFVLHYLPGWALGMTLCAMQGRFEHSGSATVSHYGALYNFLFLNDGYHVEHHRGAGVHWRELPNRRDPSTRGSRWPAALRFLEIHPLDVLERASALVPGLRGWMVRVHAAALRCVLPPALEPTRVVIVGGGIFPRSAHVCRALWPEARLTLIDGNAGNLQRAARSLDFDVDCEVRWLSGHERFDCDLLIVPLAFRGDRSRWQRGDAAPCVIVHEWWWPRRCGSVPVSLWLFKRLRRVGRS